jgi:hypothetical protein
MESLFEPLSKALGKRRLILHTGTPKTGTTALQLWLNHSRKELAKQGILYPSNVLSESKPKHQWLLEQLKPSGRPIAEKHAEAITRELADAENTSQIHSVILSTEGIYNHFHDIVMPTKDDWCKLARTCAITAIVTLRDPLSYSLSRYRQNLINPPSRHPFHATKETLESLCRNPKWLSSLDYALFIRFWEEIVGPQSLHCIPYSMFSPHEFCRAASIVHPKGCPAAPRENVSFGNLGVHLIRALNEIDLPCNQRQIAIGKILEIEASLESAIDIPFTHNNSSRELVIDYCRTKVLQLAAYRPELTLEFRPTLLAYSTARSPANSIETDPENNPAFVCCIQPGFLEEQVIVLAQSIRLFGGRFKNAPIYAISPCGEEIQNSTMRVLDSLEVCLDVRPLNTRMTAFKYANKAYALEHAENSYQHSVNVFLDSDTLFLGDPIQINLQDNIDFMARPVDKRGICRSVIDERYSDYWEKCCQVSGVELEHIPLIRTTVDKVQIHSNWNGGLLVTRRNKFIGSKWREIIERLWEYKICAQPDNFWGSGQVSFTLATTSLGLKAGILPEGYNIPIHLDQQVPRLSQIRSPIHIHYHWMLEKDHHAEGLRRIQSMALSDDARIYISSLKPFNHRRGPNCTGY